jgi:hypothetical protein
MGHFSAHSTALLSISAKSDVWVLAGVLCVLVTAHWLGYWAEQLTHQTHKHLPRWLTTSLNVLLYYYAPTHAIADQSSRCVVVCCLEWYVIDTVQAWAKGAYSYNRQSSIPVGGVPKTLNKQQQKGFDRRRTSVYLSAIKMVPIKCAVTSTAFSSIK